MNEVFSILKEYRLLTQRNLSQLGNQEKQELIRDLYSYYTSQSHLLINEYKKQAGLKLFVNTFKTSSDHFDLVVKKSLLYGSSSIIWFDYPLYCAYTGGFGKTSVSYEFPNIRRFIKLLKSFKPLIDAGNLILFPNPLASMPKEDYKFKDRNYRFYNFEPTKLSSLPVNLSQQIVREQLIESQNENLSVKGFERRLFLPYLENVPNDLLVKIRQDYPDSFERFQNCLLTFVNSHAAKNETTFYEMMRYVDLETRRLESDFRNISKSRALAGIEIAVGLASVLLCMKVSPELAAYLTPILGAKNVIDGIKYISGRSTDFHQINISDYYIPWKLTKSDSTVV